jgi:hypothetical protein
MKEVKKAYGMLRVLRQIKHFSSLINLYERRVSEDDLVQEIVTATLECGSDSTFYDVANQVRRRIREIIPYSDRTNSVYFTEFDDWKVRWGSNTDNLKEFEDILNYYEMSTFNDTCDYFELEKSHKMRKLFSAAVPKGTQVGRGNTVRVEVKEGWTAKYIQENFNVSRATAFRALKTGYFYNNPDTTKNIREEAFNAITILSKILAGKHAFEVQTTLKSSTSLSFYFTIEGQKYRLSNHKPSNWEVIPFERWDEEISIDPLSWRDVKDTVESWY